MIYLLWRCCALREEGNRGAAQNASLLTQHVWRPPARPNGEVTTLRKYFV